MSRETSKPPVSDSAQATVCPSDVRAATSSFTNRAPPDGRLGAPPSARWSPAAAGP
jgi:hypothetical protein